MVDENTSWWVFINSELGGIRDTELLIFQRERERARSVRDRQGKGKKATQNTVVLFWINLILYIRCLKRVEGFIIGTRGASCSKKSRSMCSEE